MSTMVNVAPVESDGFTTESDVWNEAIRPKPQAGHRLSQQVGAKFNPIQ